MQEHSTQGSAVCCEQGPPSCTSFAQTSASQALLDADVRTAVVKAGGKMADSGSVLFNFQRQGEIYVKGTASTEDEVCASFADEPIDGFCMHSHICSTLALQYMS